jgi:hypothetical protein
MMTSLITEIKAEWHTVADSSPGRRFMNYYRRAQRSPSTAKTAVRVAIGTVLVASGVVLWFTPGPGWLFVVFGLAMFAAQSRWLARGLDHAEVAVRDRLRRVLRWWRSR